MTRITERNLDGRHAIDTETAPAAAGVQPRGENHD